jgi:hydroxyethylthiazole kinase-like uncharacterized protein yjeF
MVTYFMNDYLYTISQIRQLERLAFTQLALAPYELMQRAGCEAFELLKQNWPQAKSIAVFCGSGNNGGDGYVLARLAHAAGLQVILYQLGDLTKLPLPARQAYKACIAAGVVMQAFTDETKLSVDVIVDALLGIGIKPPLKANYRKAIALINHTNKPVLALDVPSGLDADTGAMHEVAVKADITLTFIGIKQGLVTASAVDYCGRIIGNSLNLPQALYQQIVPSCQLLSLTHPQALLPKRLRNSHKGDYGHVLIIGGNNGMGGAVRMAGEAAARTGAGLVTIATRPEHVTAINSARPELLCFGITDPSQLAALIARATVIVIGPGLGQDSWAKALLQQTLMSGKPLVLDADALNILASHHVHRTNWILTPHPGEAARLLNITTQAVQADRFTGARRLQEAYGGIVILKGAGSLIRTENQTHVCTAGNPGMASGGMGDILTGIIASLLAQGLSLTAAATVGVVFHAQAGDNRATKQGERGMLAMDLVAELPSLINVGLR